MRLTNHKYVRVQTERNRRSKSTQDAEMETRSWAAMLVVGWRSQGMGADSAEALCVWLMMRFKMLDDR